MHRRGFPGLVVLILCAVPRAQDGLHLLPPVLFGAGDEPTDLVLMDVDGDGLGDLLVSASFGQYSAASFLGDGLGGITQVVPIGAGELVTDLAMLDLTNDGLPELATVSVDGTLRLLANAGAGQFTLAFAAGPATDLEFADANEDAKPDLIWSSSSSSYGGYILDGLGMTGGFYSGPSGIGNSSLAVADMDSDGDEDIVVAAHDFDGLRIGYTPLGSKPSVSVASGDGPRAVLVADIDADGLMDILTADDESPAFTVVHGTLGGYGPPVSTPLAAPATDLKYGDLDGDGHPDVITVTSDDGGSVVWVFDVSAGSVSAAPVPVGLGGLGESRLALGDLDGDDRLDLAATLSGDDAIAVLINDARWWNHGGGLAATGSTNPPLLVGTGSLARDSLASLKLTGAPVVSPVILVVGLSRIFHPLKGGTLVPAPDVLIAGLTTNAAGELDLSGRWPAGLQVSTQVTFQVWIEGPLGFSASDGVSAEQP